MVAYIHRVHGAIGSYGRTDDCVHTTVLEAPFHPASALAGCHGEAHCIAAPPGSHDLDRYSGESGRLRNIRHNQGVGPVGDGRRLAVDQHLAIRAEPGAENAQAPTACQSGSRKAGNLHSGCGHWGKIQGKQR